LDGNRKALPILAWNLKFESISLHRRVTELSVPQPELAALLLVRDVDQLPWTWPLSARGRQMRNADPAEAMRSPCRQRGPW
jgi:hypothetical protein